MMVKKSVLSNNKKNDGGGGGGTHRKTQFVLMQLCDPVLRIRYGSKATRRGDMQRKHTQQACVNTWCFITSLGADVDT